MIPLYTNTEYIKTKSDGKLPCECYCCGKVFYKTKHDIVKYLNNTNVCGSVIKYCSQSCNAKHSHLKYGSLNSEVSCLNCGISFKKVNREIAKNPNHFCSRSCSTTYNNKNKTHGNRRSKLEKWIEEQLINLYPNLEIHFNQKSAINSELDIYIPSLNLAFELNGIFHYEPIYGSNKLTQIKENDISKSKACHDTKIDLCIIDTSSQKYVKSSTSQKFLDIIINIINQRKAVLGIF